MRSSSIAACVRVWLCSDRHAVCLTRSLQSFLRVPRGAAVPSDRSQVKCLVSRGTQVVWEVEDAG